MAQFRHGERYEFGVFVLDCERGALSRNGTDVPLRPKSFAVLQYLLRHEGNLVSRDELTRAVWGHLHVTDNSLSQCLRDIRLAIGDVRQQLIQTVQGKGYRFETPLEPPQPNAPNASPRPTRARFWPLWLTVGVFALAAVGLAVLKSPSPGNPGLSSSESAAAPVSIAVLPLLDLSPNENMAYFADGLSEDLLNLLTGIDDLKVAARTSAFFYKGKLGQVPLKEIAAELQVTHVLEGSVRRDGEKIRVTTQLIEVEDGFHLWSQTWDRELGDLFAIQDEIAAGVVEALKIELLHEVPKAERVIPESYDLTLQAQFLSNRRSPGDLESALKLYEEATRIDPENAAAWAGVAPLYLWLFDPPRLEDALHATERAVTLDPANPVAWSRRHFALWAADDHEASQNAWDRAVELGQNSALIQAQIAGSRFRQGDIEGAIPAQERAVSLDPLMPANLGNLASYLTYGGRLSEARSVAEKLLTLVPASYPGLEQMAAIHFLEGDPEGAREFIVQRDQSPPSILASSQSTDWWSAAIEFRLGHEQAAQAALEVAVSTHADDPISLASLYALRGENDRAFEWLERALEADPGLDYYYCFSPWFNSLESDPRWQELMERWRPASHF